MYTLLSVGKTDNKHFSCFWWLISVNPWTLLKVESRFSFIDLETRVHLDWTCLSVHTCVRSVVSNSVTPWTAVHQLPLSMGFPRQEYWSWLPFLPPRDLPDPRDRTLISCIGRQIPYHCTTWETGLVQDHLAINSRAGLCICSVP